MTGPRPPGSFASFTSQSPRPAVSSLRGCAVPNQPSSRRKSSAPRSAVRSMRPSSRSVSKSKKVASQLLTTIGRRSSPSRTAWARTQRWSRRLRGPTPSLDQAQICSGVVNVAPGSSTYSAAIGLCPHQARTVGAVVRSKAKRVLPPQASAPATTVPLVSSMAPSGDNKKKGLDCRCGRTPPRESTSLVPGVSGSVVVVHSAAQSLPPKWVRWGERVASSGEAAATSKRVTGRRCRLVTVTHWRSTPSSSARKHSRTSSGQSGSTSTISVPGPSATTSSTRSRVVVVPSPWVTRNDGARRISSS